MPRFDGTGPLSYGPGTGWGAGPCGAGMAWRRRWRFGRGFGQQRSQGYGPNQPNISTKEEENILKDEVQELEDELKAVKQRLTELKTKK